MSVVYFMEGFFGKESTHGKRQVFRLQGLDAKSPYFNKKFSELEEADQRKFKQAVLRAVNIRQLGPTGESTSAYHIFERLNTGGTPLTPQEIRNCVFRGPLNKLLKDANKDKNWRKIIGKDILDKHQKDVEILLRVFSLVGKTASYEKPMKEFLNKAMKQHDKGETSRSKKFFKLFPQVTAFIIENLGEKPFHIRGPLNTSVLDAVLCVVFDHLHDMGHTDFKKNFKALIKDNQFLNLTQRGTTDTKTLRDRMRISNEHLLGD